MHLLVPRFILRQYAQGREHGRFQAAALFVDISGFTAVTEALMQQGKAGAEALADVMVAIFEPLIAAVYDRGGFVTGFAGDAFTAVFSGRRTETAARAVQTAWAIQQQMAAQPTFATPFGAFTFTAKAGAALGTVRWGILAGDGGQHTFYFRGPAIDGCAAAEHAARGGEVVLTPAVYAVVRNFVTAVPTAADHIRLTGIRAPLPVGRPRRRDNIDITSNDAAAFHPKPLLETAVRGEFRQVVTVFLNVQQPTAPALAALMRRCFQLLAQYDGYLCRLDFGDKGCNLLLFWGAPVAHENDVARALNFALDLQAATPLPLRAGVTSRLAFAGFAGSPLREEYTCYGLGVNQAARQMMAAPWGALWLDEATAQRAGAQFALTRVDRLPFKGFTAAQAVFQLDGRREAADPFFRGALVGREAELAQLQAALDPLRNGRFGGVWLISGEAGIGKSRLVHEFVSGQRSAISGQHSPFRTQHFLCQTDEILRQPLNPFRYWLRRYFRQSQTATEAANKAAFAARLDGLLAATADPDLRAELDRTRSFLGALVELYWPESLYAQLEPELRFENTLTALKALLRAESARRPVIVQLEDAHWLDAESIQFLQRLTRNVDDVPLLLLATSREADVAAQWALDDAPQTVVLTPLAETAVRQLAEAQLGGPITDGLAQALAARADGNPFFAEQMALYLQEQGALVAMDNGFAAPAIETALPLDVQAILVARLDRLTQEVKQVVQTAAVLGREFEVQVLSQMLRDEENVGRRVETAVAAAIWSPLSELRYLFKHALLRDAAYEMQLQAQLAGLHRYAAEAIVALFADDLAPHYADLAFHYRRAGDPAQEKRYAQLAGERLLSQYANEEAIRYLNRAVELADSDQELFALLISREQALDMVAQRDAQEADLRRLEAFSAQPVGAGQRAYVLERLSGFYRKIGQYDQAKSYAQAIIDQGRGEGQAVIEAIGLHLHGWTLQIQGQYKEARTYLQEASTLLSPASETSLYADIVQTLSIVLANLGDMDEALQMVKTSSDLLAQIGAQFKLSNSMNAAGLIALRQGRYREGQAEFEKALAIVREIGARGSESMIVSNLGVAHYYLGQRAAARQLFVAALHIRQETNDRWGEAMSLNNVGVIFMDEGNLSSAMDYYQQCLSVCAQIGDIGNKILALNNLGIVLLKLGDYGQARIYLQEAIEVAAESGDRVHDANARATLAYVACFEGDFETAVSYAQRAIEMSEAIGDRINVLYATVALGHAHLGLGQLTEAELAYQQARTGLAEADHETSLIPQAGLVALAMRRSTLTETLVDEMVVEINGKPPPLTTNEPLYPYLVCYQALRQLGDARADAILRQGVAQLQQMVALISDETYQTQLLQNVAVHRALILLYQQELSGNVSNQA